MSQFYKSSFFKWLTGAALIIAAILLFIFSIGNKPNETPVIDTQQKETLQEEASFHKVSLPAMMEKEYNGRDLTLGQVLAENEAYTRYYITYLSGDLKVSGIMNVPKGPGPFAVLILNHGYIDPDIYTNGRGLRREQDYLARQGYAVLHPDYRNHADSDKDPSNDLSFRLGYLEDVVNAILAVKNSSLPYLDGERIGVLGHSMGGGIAINLMVTKPDLAKAYVLFAPVSADYRDNFERWTKRRPELAQKLVETYGSPETDPEFWDNISAVNFLSNVTRPVLIHHGTSDESVPLEWSQSLYKKLQELKKESQLYVYTGEPHEFTAAWTMVMKRTVEFFDAHVKNSTAAIKF